MAKARRLAHERREGSVATEPCAAPARAHRRADRVLHQRDPVALVLVALPGGGEHDGVGLLRVRVGHERLRLAGLERGALVADDVRVAAGRGDLVVVALEGPVAREGPVTTASTAGRRP